MMATSNLIRKSAFTGIKTTNKIKYGHKMVQLIEANKEKSMLKQVGQFKQTSRDQSKPLLISCSSPVFNHFVGQKYAKFSDKCLASHGWTNRASNGKFFVINPIASHPAFKLPGSDSTMPDSLGFKQANLNPILAELLRRSFNIQRPMYIQWLCLNRIYLRDSHHLVMAETGGGKTLAYLLPILDACALMRTTRASLSREVKVCQPSAIVMVPTRELAIQVYQVAKSLLASLDLVERQLVEAGLDSSSYVDYVKQLRSVQVVLDLNKRHIQAKEIKADHLDQRLDQSTPIGPIDVLITTPNQLEKRVDSSEAFFDTTFLKHFVLDETDTLLDDSFSQVTLKCLDKLNLNFDLNIRSGVERETLEQAREAEKPKPAAAASGWINDYRQDTAPAPSFGQQLLELEAEVAQHDQLKRAILKRDSSTQLLLVSATIPRHLNNMLQDLINCEASLETIKTNRSNKLLLHVPQKFVRISADKRAEMVVDICRKETEKSSVKRTVMIFSHRTNTCTFVSKMLAENGIQNSLLTRQTTNEEREAIVTGFFDRRIRVLVCTDIASRGWDTLHVNHVINYEMPLNVSEYLHRAGRVGRPNSAKKGGAGGLITSFITKAYECELVWNIERSLRLDAELENVNANIKRLLNARAAAVDQ